MIEVKTDGGCTHLKASGDRSTIMADLSTIVSAVLEAMMQDTDDDYNNRLCTAANLCMIRSVQNARERVTKHDG